MPEVYRTSAISTGDGRNGHSRTTDGMIDVDLATPKEQGGPGGATNPEQLFAAGYAGCFHSALKVTARGEGITLTGSEVTVSVGLVKGDERLLAGRDDHRRPAGRLPANRASSCWRWPTNAARTPRPPGATSAVELVLA